MTIQAKKKLLFWRSSMDLLILEYQMQWYTCVYIFFKYTFNLQKHMDVFTSWGLKSVTLKNAPSSKNYVFNQKANLNYFKPKTATYNDGQQNESNHFKIVDNTLKQSAYLGRLENNFTVLRDQKTQNAESHSNIISWKYN